MAIELQEIHPSLVHMPLGLLPFSLGADLLGRATDNEELLSAGRATIVGAAAGAWAAGASGLLAQQEVDGDDDAFDVLITHRTLNIAGTLALTGLAWWRGRAERPGGGYLLAGLATLAAVSYSAYLGGKMVYQHGLGVEKAGGVKEGVPALRPGSLGRAAARSAKDVVEGVRLTAEETAEGKVAPALGGNGAGS